MKKVIVVFTIILLSSFTAHADEWTKEDTYLEITYLAIHIADWGNTLYIADHPEDYHEINPILGRHPSRSRVNNYFMITGLLHPAISYALPQPYRQYWQYATVGIEAGVVGWNLSIGIGFGF